VAALLYDRRDDRALEEGQADKGIKFFNEVDQSKLAADADITLRPSVLLIFGNSIKRNLQPMRESSCFLQSCSRSHLDVLHRRGLSNP
jgi:hypothetical protein